METPKRFVFPSVRTPDVRYTFDLTSDIDRFMDLLRHPHGDPLGAVFGQFNTLGDGDTQHTPETFVSTYDSAIDYLLSFGAAVQARMHTHHQMPPNLIGALTTALDREFYCPSPTVIRAAFQNPYKGASKPRYLQCTSFEVSSAPSKANDKRYMLLEPRHDGTVRGVLNVLHDAARVASGNQHHTIRHLFERMVRAEAVCAVAREFDAVEYGVAKTATELDYADPQRENLDRAFIVFRTAYDALRNLNRLSRVLASVLPPPADAPASPEHAAH